MKLLVTEIGYSTKPGGEVTELQQAAYLARVVMLNRQVKSLIACVWHNGIWTMADTRREYDFGIMRGKHESPRREPKPAFAAWATVSRLTYDAEYVREIPLGKDVHALLFNRRGHQLLALWSLAPKPVQVHIPLNTAEVQVTEMCGHSETMPVTNGVVTLFLDEAPVYIEGNIDNGFLSEGDSPSEGHTLGISVLVNDLDGKIRQSLSWFDGIETFKEPSLYGRAILVK